MLENCNQMRTSSDMGMHLSPPTPDPNGGPWRPFSSSKDFDAHIATILIILACALVCALALNAVIRYFLSHSRRRPETSENEPRKSTYPDATMVVAPPTLVFSAGMKLAGVEAECAICLSEFLIGELIRVLPRCKHGFHVQCIEKWLYSHASCPTCRISCLTTSPEINVDSLDVDVESQEEVPQRGSQQPRE
ncbi:hypothetical protein HHK36_023394 [Tetracentron sinense]|uniref:RING-type domain-containing protein n=1 Tax=Tetracentron sinense TaxID=13715 RepID=A0A834YL74_TETSI|nr:hypothetical protein HHK36_023394 [Tetracentron sinense]